jgi:hypothetical protein
MTKHLRAVSFAVLLAAAPAAHAAGWNGFWVGLNGVLTAPADPVLGFADPPASFQELPMQEVSGRILGLVQGSLLGAYRAASGLVDIVATSLWVVPTISPPPRFVIGVNEPSRLPGMSQSLRSRLLEPRPPRTR